MSKYRLSRQADTDLERIADYIADFNPTAASDVLDALFLPQINKNIPDRFPSAFFACREGLSGIAT